MKKTLVQRVLLLALSIALLLPSVTISALAAEGSQQTGGNISLDVADLSASYTWRYAYYASLRPSSSKGGGNWSGSGTELTGMAKGYSGFLDNYSGESTLTLTNTAAEKRKLSFYYENNDINGGTATFSNGDNPSSGPYSTELEGGASLTIKLESAAGDSTAKVRLSNLKLIREGRVTVRFQIPDYGNYTVQMASDGVVNTITTNTSTELSLTQASTQQYNVSATADSQHKFMGWYNVTDGKYESFLAKTSFVFEKDAEIKPVFIDKSTCIFAVGSQSFTDLNDANAYASNNEHKIVLVSDGTLPAGNYTISSGNTLLIPFDSANTLYTTQPEVVENGPTNAPAYRTLTMGSGANITVEGAISISAKLCAASGGQLGAGSPTGSAGYIRMEDGSNITVNSGGALYAWGFITTTSKNKNPAESTASVIIKRGGSVYESFQISDFRGGNQSAFMQHEVFAISQYYAQNVEVPMTVYAGATEKGRTALYVSGSTPQSEVSLIGSSGAMFNLANGYIVKRYDGASDRLIIDIHGDTSLSSIKIKVYLDIDSSKYDLALNSNITVNLKGGSVTCAQDLVLQPGVQINIDEGTTFTLQKGQNMYVYDSEQWGGYCGTYDAKFIPVPYAPGRTYNRTESDLTDATILVNGTLNADSGYLYTTESGANIYSTASGMVNITLGNQETTYQLNDQADTYSKIPITSAKLHNGDGSYTETAKAGAGTYKVCEYCKKWYKVGSHYTVKLYVDGSETAQTSCSDTNPVTFSDVKSCIKSQCDDTNVTVSASDTGLTISNLPSGVSNVYIWTKYVAQIGETQYVSLWEAVKDYDKTGYIKMIENSKEPGFTIDKAVYLDLNGKTVTLTSALSGSSTLYGMDSKTDDYVGQNAGTLIVEGSDSQIAKVFQTNRKADNDYSFYRYVAIPNGENSYSFHRFNISVTGYRYELSLVNGEGLMVVQGSFQGDDKVKQNVTELAFVLDGEESSAASKEVDGKKDYGMEAYLCTALKRETVNKTHIVHAKASFGSNSQLSTEHSLSFASALEQAGTDADRAALEAFLKEQEAAATE